MLNLMVEKGQAVAEEHRAPEVPQNDIYLGVVSIETVKLAFILAVLNSLEVYTAGFSTAFLYGRSKEKVYIITGKEFGENKGKGY